MGRKGNIQNTKSKKTKVKKLKLDKKKRVILIILFILLVIILAIKNYDKLGLVLKKNITTKDATKVELTTVNNKLLNFGDDVLVCSSEKIECYSKNGKNKWDILVEDSVNNEINSSGRYIQIVNKEKQMVYIYKNQYELARIKIDGTIYSGSINKDGTSVIEYNLNGAKTALGIYSSKGKKLYDIKLSNNIIGKYVLSGDSRHLTYVDVDTKGISAYTTVNLVDLKSSLENVKKIYEIENSLVYNIYFVGKKVVIKDDENYSVYSIGSGEIKTQKITELTPTIITEDNLKCAYTLVNEGKSISLNVKEMLKDKTKNIKLSNTPKYLLYSNSLVYVCYQKQIEVYNVFGNNIKTYSSDTAIVDPICFNDGKSIAMIVSNKLLMFTI